MTDIVKHEGAPPTLFGTNKPTEVVQAASAHATALKDVIESQNLYANISGKKHVQVQGWTLLGSMLGVYPVLVHTRRLTADKDGVDGWEARVEARLRDGSVVGAAESQCDRTEHRWASADEYAIRSMAQTRATSRALRQPLDFVMQLAGFDATPAEEVPPGGFQRDGVGSDSARYICPGCNQQTVTAVRSSNEKAPKWRCNNEGCTGGKDGRTWASWHNNPPGVQAAGPLGAIDAAVQAGEITKPAALKAARDAAAQAGETQPSRYEDIAGLKMATVQSIVTALGIEHAAPAADDNVVDAEVVEEPEGW